MKKKKYITLPFELDYSIKTGPKQKEEVKTNIIQDDTKIEEFKFVVAVKEIEQEIKEEPKEIENRKEINNTRGDITIISTEEKVVNGLLKYVVHVERQYSKGGSYVEPAHYWDTPIEARKDISFWNSIATHNNW